MARDRNSLRKNVILKRDLITSARDTFPAPREDSSQPTRFTSSRRWFSIHRDSISISTRETIRSSGSIRTARESRNRAGSSLEEIYAMVGGQAEFEKYFEIRNGEIFAKSGVDTSAATGAYSSSSNSSTVRKSFWFTWASMPILSRACLPER